MAIPALDVVIAFTGGNYAQAVTYVSQREFIPKFILPAIFLVPGTEVKF